VQDPRFNPDNRAIPYWDNLGEPTGSLLGVAGAAFIVEPFGDVPTTATYVTNTVLLAIVLLLLARAA
jgi:hypothetical protein